MLLLKRLHILAHKNPTTSPQRKSNLLEVVTNTDIEKTEIYFWFNLQKKPKKATLKLVLEKPQRSYYCQSIG